MIVGITGMITGETPRKQVDDCGKCFAYRFPVSFVIPIPENPPGLLKYCSRIINVHESCKLNRPLINHFQRSSSDYLDKIYDSNMKSTGGGWYTYPLLLCDSFNQIFSVLIFDQSTNLMHSTIINC